MKNRIKTVNPVDQKIELLTAATVYSYSQEYKMDPTRLKLLINNFNLESKCAEAIKEILNEQQTYIRKCTNAKILMEKNIVRILKRDDFKRLLFG